MSLPRRLVGAAAWTVAEWAARLGAWATTYDPRLIEQNRAAFVREQNRTREDRP